MTRRPTHRVQPSPHLILRPRLRVALGVILRIYRFLREHVAAPDGPYRSGGDEGREAEEEVLLC
jgi:hypothetical protein